ncbi:MAG: hypothetical protein PVF58_09735 [Candidatus Methanofastidiosia archaeon]|jgi:hypothetical protein
MISRIFETDDNPALKDIIKAAGGTITIEYTSVNMLAASIPQDALKTIQKSPHCLRVYKDTKRTLV